MQGSINKTLASTENGTDNQVMDAVVRKFDSLKEMKTDEYRYWRSRPVHERMSAVAEITLAAYAMKGIVPDVRRLQSTVVLLQRPRR
jgi:hypothetical protein